MCVCDYDPPEFFHQEERKARKAYKCEECRCDILPGEKYVYSAGKWEGTMDQFRWCLNCKRAQQEFVHNSECGCWAFGNLQGDMMDEWRDSGGMLWLGRLLVGMRSRWKTPHFNRVFSGPIKLPTATAS